MRIKVADWYTRGLSGDNPKVSVATITYKHEAFIAEAIESVLMQEVDFPVEMVIGEDCSPDGARDIILQYKKKYPGFIHLSDYGHNVGANRNFLLTLARCRGQYVALLDGDDYWTSPHKLQMQVDLLDSNPRFSMCCHAFNRERGGKVVSAQVRPTGRKPVYQLADLSQWVNILPLSMVYRRQVLPDLPPWFGQVDFGDWAMQVLLAEKGDIAYVDEVMGTHRLHNANGWCENTPSKAVIIQMQIKHAELFAGHLADKRAFPYRRYLARRYYELIHTYLDTGDLEKARETLQGVRRMYGYDPRVDLLEPWLVMLHIKVPSAYRWLRPHASHLNRIMQPWERIVRPAFDRVLLMTSALRKP